MARRYIDIECVITGSKIQLVILLSHLLGLHWVENETKEKQHCSNSLKNSHFEGIWPLLIYGKLRFFAFILYIEPALTAAADVWFSQVFILFSNELVNLADGAILLPFALVSEVISEVRVVEELVTVLVATQRRWLAVLVHVTCPLVFKLGWDSKISDSSDNSCCATEFYLFIWQHAWCSWHAFNQASSLWEAHVTKV